MLVCLVSEVDWCGEPGQCLCVLSVVDWCGEPGQCLCVLSVRWTGVENQVSA